MIEHRRIMKVKEQTVVTAVVSTLTFVIEKERATT